MPELICDGHLARHVFPERHRTILNIFFSTFSSPTFPCGSHMAFASPYEAAAATVIQIPTIAGRQRAITIENKDINPQHGRERRDFDSKLCQFSKHLKLTDRSHQRQLRDRQN
jgi:hypothetical protein